MAVVSPTITQADIDAASDAWQCAADTQDLWGFFAHHREQAVVEKGKRIEELEAENARLREALIVLRNLPIVENDNPDTLWIDGEPHRGPAVDFLFKMARSIKEVARKALEGRIRSKEQDDGE